MGGLKREELIGHKKKNQGEAGRPRKISSKGGRKKETTQTPGWGGVRPERPRRKFSGEGTPGLARQESLKQKGKRMCGPKGNRRRIKVHPWNQWGVNKEGGGSVQSPVQGKDRKKGGRGWVCG